MRRFPLTPFIKGVRNKSAASRRIVRRDFSAGASLPKQRNKIPQKAGRRFQMTSTTSSSSTTANRTLNTRTERLAREFVRLNTKFSKQNEDGSLNRKEIADLARKAVVQNERRDFPSLDPITTEDVANAVLEMMAAECEQRQAQIEEQRKARLVECPACGIRRRDSRFEHCAACTRLDAENEALIKAGKLRPNAPLSLEEIDAIANRQQTAACEELYKLFEAGQLPEGCEIVSVSATEVRIQAPNTLFVLDLTDVRAAEAASAQPAKGYGKRKRTRRPRAEVHELSIEQVDQGWDDETVAA